jgi:hypothetical protein
MRTGNTYVTAFTEERTFCGLFYFTTLLEQQTVKTIIHDISPRQQLEKPSLAVKCAYVS